MPVISGCEIVNTDYVYSMFLEQPFFARDHIYRYHATLITLVHASHTRELPVLSAWGKTEQDAQENLEGTIREWIASGAAATTAATADAIIPEP